MMSFRKRICVVVLPICLVFEAVGSSALATNVKQVVWDSSGQGNYGNFDLDFQVNAGPYPVNVTYGTHSAVSFDANGFYIVNNRLGWVSTFMNPPGPDFVQDVGALNVPNPLAAVNSPSTPNKLEMRWIHETSTLAYDTLSKKWIGFWHTYLVSHPYNNGPNPGPSDPWYIAPTGICSDTSTTAAFPSGRPYFRYGWIGMKTWTDQPGSSWATPDLATLSAMESRVFKGEGYVDTIQSTTDSWATGSPAFPRGAPTGPAVGGVYAVFLEPGAYMDNSTGTLYLAMTALYVTNCNGYGDIILMKSNDDGATWTYVNTVLTAQQATAIDPTWVSFTASSMHQDPHDGSIRLIVSGVDSTSSYKGIVEFKFANIAAGTLATLGNNLWVQGFEPKQPGVFSGAGTFNFSTGKHIEGQIATSSVPFQEWELSW